MTSTNTEWPPLPLDEWRDTYATLQLWTQIVGKVHLALAPPVNHWWHVPLYVSARGLTTSPMPHGVRSFEVEFDFIAHQLVIRVSDGTTRSLPLRPQTVADFYGDFMAALTALGLRVTIWPMPVEIADAIPFEKDTTHAAYDPEYAHRFWQILVNTARVMQEFRGQFLGKCSPVHFFWGSFDLAVTRFSGRLAPQHPGAPNVADSVTREAYSHEVSSAGFWPGGGPVPYPVFYSYAYPAPSGFADRPIRPDASSFNTDLGEFILPYDAMRQAESPENALREFLQSAYEAAAECARWDRAALERH